MPPGGRPALVMSHGGAFHRGAKDKDEFEQDGSHNTPVHEYCERNAIPCLFPNAAAPGADGGLGRLMR